MLRMSRIVLLAVLCTLPAFAPAQEFPAGDDQQPAPGEPNGAVGEDSEIIERFDRVAPIEGTAPADVDLGEATDLGQPTQVPPQSPSGESAAGRTDATDGTPQAGDTGDLPAAPGEPTEAAARPELQAEFQKLRDEIERRLVALERRLDEQTARIDALDATAIAAARPAEGAGPMDAEQAQQRQDQVAQLKQELEQLRSDIAAQLRNGVDGETTTAARPVVTVEAHRLRIHNTTGVEQPISINGVQWTVRADEWSSVPIPRGPVTVHRPGREPLEIAAEQIDWQSDRRGYFFDYDLDEHRLAQPTEE